LRSLLTTVLVMLLVALSGEDRSTLLKEKAAELRRLREKCEAERTRLLDEIRSLKERKRGIIEMKSKMSGEVEENERRVAALKGECEALRSEEAALAKRLDGYSETLDAAVQRLKKRIETGLPYLRSERLQRLSELEETDGENPQKKLDGLLDLFAKEMRILRSWEAYRDFVEHPDGRKLRGYILRAGLVMLAFVADGGEVAFLLQKDGLWRWRFVDSVAIYHSLREAIRQVRRTTIPDIVRLPFPVECLKK